MEDGVREREKASVLERWMNEKDIGTAPHVALYLLSLVYGAAVKLRLFLYGTGLLKSEKLPCKVVSVGNITVGGSGKTPVTIYIASRLREKGMKVAILSRGYGRSSKGVKVVSDGERVLLGPEEAGDEPCLMAERLEGVPVIVGEERVRSGRLAIERFSPDVLLLDDGFQHIKIERDVNLLLLDSKRGFGNGFLVPRGVLREPVNAVARADIVMVKGDGPDNPPAAELKKPVIKFSYNPTGLVEVKSDTRTGVERLNGKRVLAVAGIAEPGSFLETLREAGAEVVGYLAYPDHHRYTPAEMKEIEDASQGADIVVTTGKDAVKLKPLCGAGISVW
ncbi:MAG: tetraacyldisaccharide 4'-kinase, partial [Thermodesulfobacteriota bacterium]